MQTLQKNMEKNLAQMLVQNMAKWLVKISMQNWVKNLVKQLNAYLGVEIGANPITIFGIIYDVAIGTKYGVN